ncbi:MAG: type II secretion system F family protein [Gammaproteobacteria bacterium]|nr:type II secretion system F family protein [Gammaproteobacteria bacterium]
MSDGMMLFIGMVFVAAFLLSQGLVVPVFGETGRTRKLLKERLGQLDAASEQGSLASLLREKYLRELSPVEQWLESLPGMQSLAAIIEQAGKTMPAYRLVLISVALGALGGMAGWAFSRSPLVALGCAIAGLAIPYVKILGDRRKRIEKFEEQLPDAIDSMKRALRAGHPFSAALKLVAEDMDDPVAREFELTFADISYGNDLRRAMLGLLQRMPSVTVMALVTSVLVQKETGGNLAEILEQISGVIRSRFRFQRKVRSLSAEGRLSAWILAMTPFVLFVVISVSTPEYLPVLLEHPTGQKLIAFAFVMGIAGIFWIRRVIRIEV